MGCNCKPGESHEIIDIIRDVVSRVSAKMLEGGSSEVQFLHGSSVYIKEVLDILTQSSETANYKYPLVVLFTPIEEERNVPELYTSAELQVSILNGSVRNWTNDERERFGFCEVLRPIYRLFLEELKKDKRIRKEYDGNIPHRYSENYSYGRYGAVDANGEMLSDPIDAINIKSLRLKVKPNKNCTR